MIGTVEFFRTIAFAAIFLHHLAYGGGRGAIAVSAFIVIAGFVSSKSITRFKTINCWKLVEYYFERAIRIYPVHLLTFLVSLPVMGFTHHKYSFSDTLFNILLLHSWFFNGSQIFSYNSLSWFLSTIVFFSLVTPFVLFLIIKTNIYTSVTKLCFLGIVLFAIAIYITLKFKGNVAPYSFGWWFIYASPYFRFFDYILGIIAGLICLNLKQSNHVRFNIITFTFLEILSLMAFILFLRVPYCKYDSIVQSIYYTPACIFIVATFSFQRGLFSFIINNPLSVYFGRLSFSAFMIHGLIIMYIAQLFSPSIWGYSSDPRHLFAQAIVFLFVMCAADVIYRHYEVPSQKILKKYLRKYIVPN